MPCDAACIWPWRPARLSGKSTLMKVLVGALAADAGTVARTGRLGYCPQEPVLYARLTCDEYFELYGHAYGMTDGQMRQSRREIYTTLGFERYGSSRADQLSGGTQAKLDARRAECGVRGNRGGRTSGAPAPVASAARFGA
jgi:ABC-type Na+ transport system ATPase subunit NatA